MNRATSQATYDAAWAVSTMNNTATITLRYFVQGLLSDAEPSLPDPKRIVEFYLLHSATVP